MNRDVHVDRVFDPRGDTAPRWRVFRWHGDQRIVLGMYATEDAALEAARKATA